MYASGFLYQKLMCIFASYMTDHYFIPRTIKVGYQERSDTYTGRLAYVIYYDQKNSLRKENSWKGWCNSKLGSNDFDNVPTEGFVLNKSVGGYKSDWNYRSAYFRVYDPRGFEFEITPQNLLWILDWCTCSPGKGIEGKFVYGWSGEQLILIPCNTKCYEICYEYSERMFVGVTKDSLEPGSIYRIKSDGDLLYIGCFKVVKQMGKSYTSKYMFLNKTNRYKKSCTTYDVNCLVVKDKSAILHKISEGPLTQDEIDDIAYRFSICPLSYDFWHNKNLIDHFIKSPVDKIGPYWSNNDKNFIKCSGIISENGKSVILNKPAYFPNYVSYDCVTITNRVYNFATLTADMNLTKIADLGKYTKYDYWKIRNTKDYNLFYKYTEKTPKDKLKFVNQDESVQVCYVTKDGYVGDFAFALLDGYLSFLKHPIPSSIALPEKYNKN